MKERELKHHLRTLRAKYKMFRRSNLNKRAAYIAKQCKIHAALIREVKAHA